MELLILGSLENLFRFFLEGLAAILATAMATILAAADTVIAFRQNLQRIQNMTLHFLAV